jgi:hypothetical protein
MLFALRSIVLFSSSLAASRVFCGGVTSVPRRRARGTGRDAGLRCRRSWCRAAAMQASRNCRRPPVRRIYWHASPRKNCPNIWASSFMLDYTDETGAAGRVAEYVCIGAKADVAGRVLTRSRTRAAVVKGFGCRPVEGRLRRLGGRRPKPFTEAEVLALRPQAPSYVSSSSNALACFKSNVSKPSVNQP